MIQGWSVAGKAWVGFAGAVLAFLLPYIARVAAEFPQPWPAVVGGIIAVLTGLGVYKAPSTHVAEYNSGGADSETPWPSA